MAEVGSERSCTAAPLYAFMAWTRKPLPLRNLIVVILFQKCLNAGAQEAIQIFRHATGAHSPTHMHHHQLHLCHEKEKQASENLCSQLIKRFEYSFQ